jgi:spore germination protein KC
VRNLLTVVIIIPMLLFTGCWDKDELEDWGYVAAIGIDKAEDNKLEITFQVTNPQVGTSLNANVPEPPQEIVTLPAFNIVSVKDLASTSVTRRLTLSHSTAIIVSEDFAKSDEFYRVICTTIRNRDIRGDLNIIVCKEKASEFINNISPKLETRPHKYFYFMTKRWKDTGLTPNANLHRLIQRTELDNGIYLSIYGTAKKGARNKQAQQESDHLPGGIDKKGGNPAELIGSAVFKKGKMIGKLTGAETQLSMLLRSKQELRSTIMNIPDPLDKSHKISIRIAPSGNPKIKMDLSSDSPKIDTNIKLQVVLIGIPSGINYVTDLEKNRLLKSSIENFLNEKGEQLIKKTQKEFGGEPFLWGYEAQKHFKTMKELEEYNWMEKYPKARINLQFTITKINNGRIFETTNLNNRDLQMD